MCRPPRNETAADTMVRLLADRRFDVEYRDYRTNHAKHSVIALTRLGASAKDVSSYYEVYVGSSPRAAGVEPARKAERHIDTKSWNESLGDGVDFEAYRLFFEAQLRQRGQSATFERYLPTLMAGCAGALLHGMIHLGWALDAKHPAMVAEGLAYLAHAWIDVHASELRFGADTDAEMTLARIARTYEQQDIVHWLSGLEHRCELQPGNGLSSKLEGTGLQLTVAQILKHGHPLVDQ